MITPQQAAEKLGRRIAQSGQDYLDGVNRVTENPMQKAAAKSDKWMSRLQEAHANGKWVAGLNRVSLPQWKTQVQQKGVSRYTQSANQAQTKYADFAQTFFPYLQTVQDEIAAMPDNTLQDSINRMVRNAQRLSEFRR